MFFLTSRSLACSWTHAVTGISLACCSSVGGASVYQSVSRVSLQLGSDLGHAAPRDPEWTHPRIQGDSQENKRKRMYTWRIRMPAWGKAKKADSDKYLVCGCPHHARCSGSGVSLSVLYTSEKKTESRGQIWISFNGFCIVSLPVFSSFLLSGTYC